MSQRRTLPGFMTAMAAIRRSPTPLVLYWRHTLRVNAKNRVLALPLQHNRPSCGMVVGIYDQRIFGSDKASNQAGMAKIKADLQQTIDNYIAAD